MPNNKFQLDTYLPDVLKIAAANKVSSTAALQYFITNLTIMREHRTGAGHLNYRLLGQLWNNLPNNERVAQKAMALSKLKAPAVPEKK